MLTVPEAARRAGKNPETVRRWIREGRLPARKVGTQHVIDEIDLEEVLGERSRSLPVPEEWTTFPSGRPQPDWLALLDEVRRGR